MGLKKNKKKIRQLLDKRKKHKCIINTALKFTYYYLSIHLSKWLPSQSLIITSIHSFPKNYY